MFGSLFKKDPEMKELPLGAKVLKAMFTGAVSVTTGALGDRAFMIVYKSVSKTTPKPPTTDSE